MRIYNRKSPGAVGKNIENLNGILALTHWEHDPRKIPLGLPAPPPLALSGGGSPRSGSPQGLARHCSTGTCRAGVVRLRAPVNGARADAASGLCVDSSIRGRQQASRRSTSWRGSRRTRYRPLPATRWMIRRALQPMQRRRMRQKTRRQPKRLRPTLFSLPS